MAVRRLTAPDRCLFACAMTATLPRPPALADLVSGPLAVFLDFDGTLVEIAERPEGIDVPDGLANTLAEISRRLEGRLALVSGRGIADLEFHCGPLVVACAGSHGLDLRAADGAALGSPAAALSPAVVEEVRQFAAEKGVDFEDKPHGAALHSRRAPAMEQACAVFLADVAAREGLGTKRGKRVCELVPAGANKGAAVRAFMANPSFAGAMPVFVGDDVTDEDGFAACSDLGGFGIAVGSRISENARYALADPAAVQQWLSG